MAITNEGQSTLSYAATISTDANSYGKAFSSIIVTMQTKLDHNGIAFLKGTWDWTMKLQKFEGGKWVDKATKTGYLSASSSSSRSFTRTDTGSDSGTFRVRSELVLRPVAGSNRAQKATLTTRAFNVKKA